jgi:hypothetical protein
MRPLLAVVIVIVGVSLSASCGGSMMTHSATAPSSAIAVSSAPLDSSIIGFSGLTTDTAAVTSYAESTFRVSMPSGDWRARTTYGNPAPFIQFWAEAGSTVTGEIQVTATSPTYFKSVDLYASTTPIPYVIKGLRNSAVVFTMSGTVSNTFGSFRTVSNPNAVLIDTLSIALTNTAAACCRNPMGLDNIALSDTPAAPPQVFSLSGTVTDSATGASVSGARVSVASGPDYGTSTTTNASGSYTLTGLSQGGLSVTATATNYLSGSQTIYLSANQTLAFRLAPKPGAIQYPTPPAGATIIGFNGLTTNGAAVTSYTESGFTVSATLANWVASTTYGRPAPFIQFFAEPSTAPMGRVEVTAGGSTFTFASAELYSSTSRIPYTITGTKGGATVFTLNGEVPNTFGNFAAVVNPNTAGAVDKVAIVLTNTTGSVRNPMGVDNIVVVR